MDHELKIQKEYFENLLSGRKTNEVRFNDRDYQLNDNLVFWSDHESENFQKYIFSITHIHSGLGMADGYIVLSLKRIT